MSTKTKPNVNQHQQIIDRLFPLSVQQVADQLGETKYIIQNWTRDLRPFIPIYKNKSGYNVFHKDGFTVFALIQYLHRDLGYPLKQLRGFFLKDLHEISFIKNVEEVLFSRYPNMLDKKALEKAFSGTIYYEEEAEREEETLDIEEKGVELPANESMLMELQNFLEKLLANQPKQYPYDPEHQKLMTVKIENQIQEINKQMIDKINYYDDKLKHLEKKIDDLTEINTYLFHVANKNILTSPRKKQSFWKMIKKGVNHVLTWCFRIK